MHNTRIIRRLLREARIERDASKWAAQIDAIEHQLTHTTDPCDRGDIAHALAAYHRSTPDLQKSRRFAELAVLAEQTTGRTARLGNHLMFWAKLLRAQHQFPEALEAARQGLECYIQSHGADHGEVRFVQSVVDTLERECEEGKKGF